MKFTGKEVNAMSEQEVPLLKNHVITRCRNGRRYYDPKAKEAVARYAVMPCVSLAELARSQGISQSQLRRWIREYEQRSHVPQAAADTSSAFIPVTVAHPSELSSASHLPMPTRYHLYWKCYASCPVPPRRQPDSMAAPQAGGFPQKHRLSGRHRDAIATARSIETRCICLHQPAAGAHQVIAEVTVCPDGRRL